MSTRPPRLRSRAQIGDADQDRRRRARIAPAADRRGQLQPRRDLGIRRARRQDDARALGGGGDRCREPAEIACVGVLVRQRQGRGLEDRGACGLVVGGLAAAVGHLQVEPQAQRDAAAGAPAQRAVERAGGQLEAQALRPAPAAQGARPDAHVADVGGHRHAVALHRTVRVDDEVERAALLQRPSRRAVGGQLERRRADALDLTGADPELREARGRPAPRQARSRHDRCRASHDLQRRGGPGQPRGGERRGGAAQAAARRRPPRASGERRRG